MLSETAFLQRYKKWLIFSNPGIEKMAPISSLSHVCLESIFVFRLDILSYRGDTLLGVAGSTDHRSRGWRNSATRRYHASPSQRMSVDRCRQSVLRRIVRNDYNRQVVSYNLCKSWEQLENLTVCFMLFQFDCVRRDLRIATYIWEDMRS